jgi:hypothetical protein
MAKDVKFNINLSVIGKNVVAQCKASVEGLSRALGTVPTKAEQALISIIKWASISATFNNLYAGLS